MKASETLIESLGNMAEVTTQGDLRRIVSNSMLALVRKQISATDVETLAKGLDSISNSLNAEIKVHKVAMELRAAGGSLGKTVELGALRIGTPDKPSI